MDKTDAQKRHMRRAKGRAKRNAEKASILAPCSVAAAVAAIAFPAKALKVPPVAVHVAPDPHKRQKVVLGALIDAVENSEREYLLRSRALAKKHEPVPEEGLIDVWKNYSTFVVTPMDPEEASWAHISFAPVQRPGPTEPADWPSLRNCLQGCDLDKAATSGTEQLPDVVHSLIGSYALPASVVERETFLSRFQTFTSRQFEGWKDWKNMLVIGGAVVASLLPFSTEVKDVHEYYFSSNDCWTSSDIDVYFYGLSDAEFGKKIYSFYQHLLKKNGKVAVMRTPYTVTFVSDYPARNIQIVLGRWASASQILMEPDIDCSAVGFDGSRVWATKRSRLSYNHRWILATQERYELRTFPEYEERLYKYSRRGFAIVDRLVKGDFSDVSQKHMRIGEQRLMEHKAVRGRAGITGMRLLYLAATNKTIRESVDLFKIEKYKSEGIPYGPEWNVDNICLKMMEPVFETTHYGPHQVESRFIVLKPEAASAKQLAVSKPPYERPVYFREPKEPKPELPKSVATADYFAKEVRLVYMEENSDESRRWRTYQWHAYLKGSPRGYHSDEGDEEEEEE